MINALLGKIADSVFSIIDQVVGERDLREKLKSRIQMAMLDRNSDIVKASRDIIVSESSGGLLQRNWRPVTMLSFTAILVNNFILAPYIQAFGGVAVILEIPQGMWNLLTIGIGGYVGGRTIEKSIYTWKKDNAENS